MKKKRLNLITHGIIKETKNYKQTLKELDNRGDLQIDLIFFFKFILVLIIKWKFAEITKSLQCIF